MHNLRARSCVRGVQLASEAAMDQTTFMILLGSAVGFVSTGILPNYLRLKPKGYRLILAVTFLAFFLVTLRNVLGRYDLWEVLFRAFLSGMTPIVGGYLFVYFTKDSFPKK